MSSFNNTVTISSQSNLMLRLRTSCSDLVYHISSKKYELHKRILRNLVQNVVNYTMGIGKPNFALTFLSWIFSLPFKDNVKHNRNTIILRNNKKGRNK